VVNAHLTELVAIYRSIDDNNQRPQSAVRRGRNCALVDLAKIHLAHLNEQERAEALRLSRTK